MHNCHPSKALAQSSLYAKPASLQMSEQRKNKDGELLRCAIFYANFVINSQQSVNNGRKKHARTFCSA